jgi:hypothetical protein
MTGMPPSSAFRRWPNNHLSSIYAKLGVHSQVDLIRLIRRGTDRPAADQ